MRYIENIIFKLALLLTRRNTIGKYHKELNFIFESYGVKVSTKNVTQLVSDLVANNANLQFEHHSSILVIDCQNVDYFRIYCDEIGKRAKGEKGKYLIKEVHLRYFAGKQTFNNVVKNLQYYNEKLMLQADEKINTWVNECKKYEDEPSYSDERIVGKYVISFYSNKVRSNSYNFRITIRLNK